MYYSFLKDNKLIILKGNLEDFYKSKKILRLFLNFDYNMEQKRLYLNFNYMYADIPFYKNESFYDILERTGYKEIIFEHFKVYILDKKENIFDLKIEENVNYKFIINYFNINLIKMIIQNLKENNDFDNFLKNKIFDKNLLNLIKQYL